MLGLGSSCNSEEGYAKGERYRERFHEGGTYHVTTNPIGREGKESDYLGSFASAGDIDSFIQTNGILAIFSGVVRLRVTAANGFAWITVSVVPFTSYTIRYLNDPNSVANGSSKFKVGTTLGGNDMMLLLLESKTLQCHTHLPQPTSHWYTLLGLLMQVEEVCFLTRYHLKRLNIIKLKKRF